MEITTGPHGHTRSHCCRLSTHCSDIHLHVNPVSIEKLCMCLTGYKNVNELLYPCEVPLETVDVQLRLLGVDIGADGEEILKQGDRTEKRGDQGFRIYK